MKKTLKGFLNGVLATLIIEGGLYLIGEAANKAEEAEYEAGFQKGRADRFKQILDMEINSNKEMVEEISKICPEALDIAIKYADKKRELCAETRKEES